MDNHVGNHIALLFPVLVESCLNIFLNMEVSKMNSCMKKVCVWLLILLLPVMFLACSGGGSGSGGAAPAATSSLQVADKVSVVDAKLSGSVAAVAPLHIGLFKVTAADLAAAADYNADKTQVYVSERSAEAFNEINNILCMVSQTKGDAMLNKGAYVALVDQTQCDTNKSDASSAGQDSQNQSSSSGMPDYTTFTVLATRADNNSPEYLKVWVHMKQKGSDPEQIILVNLTITEGKSDTNPYGLFTMDFLGHPSTNGVMTSGVSFKGVMKAERNAAGEVLLKFAEENYGGYPCVRKITLNRQGDGSSGTGSVYDQHNEMNSGITTTVTSQFDIAFNTDNFLRNDGTTTICLDRNNFEESAWRYGLYDSNGARVDRNSGFSVNTKADGSGSYGFVGYWGLWLDNNATITNNTLYKFDYSSANAAPIAYTVFTAGGKLKKHTKKMMTLADIKGVPLNYSVCNQNGCSNDQVVWNGADQKFYITAIMPSNCSNNCQWQNITPVALDLTTLQWGELNFWSQSLSGQVRVPLANCIQSFPTCTSGPCAPPSTTCDAPVSTTNVIFFAEDLVYPTDTIPSSFACYDNCPQIDGSGQAYINTMTSGPSNTATNYTFNPTSMLLQLNGSSVIMSQTSSTNPYGVMSGALFDPTSANLAALDCNWDWDNNPATSPQVCGWKAWSALDVFYTWETGPDSWNQFSALKDGTGAMLKFEPPLSVKYVHNKAPYVGATFMLDYSGFGNLNGIPGKCVDMDSGLEVQCSSSNTVRYVPAFVIPPTQEDGTLTKVTVDTTEYLVKPLELEQRMMPVDVGYCSTLSVTPYTLPDLATEWTDPAIGTEPVVTAAPAVIGGVVQ
jgi:hypothetical protein